LFSGPRSPSSPAKDIFPIVDLAKTYPRSVHEKLHGLVRPMDRAVFGFLGIDHERFLDTIRNAAGDEEIHRYVKGFIDEKSPEEIERWNQEWVSRKPQGESLQFFLQLRSAIAPDRTGVTTWADVLDLDEKRPVPVLSS
jgi:hypothetical protein